MRAPLIATLISLTVLAAAAGPVRAQSLLTGVSSNLISITSNFTGTELVLFGRIDQPGNVIIVIRGPEIPVVVRRKERKAGIWVNSESITFDGVPGFYSVYANDEIQHVTSHTLRSRLQIGAENLVVRPRDEIDETDALPYKDALIRDRLEVGLFQEDVGNVTFLGKQLFHTKLAFPANVPVGTYTIQVYLVSDDVVIAAQSTPLFIAKSGVERELFDFAHNQPFLYGIAAIVVALFSGWLAATIFRKT